MLADPASNDVVVKETMPRESLRDVVGALRATSAVNLASKHGSSAADLVLDVPSVEATAQRRCIAEDREWNIAPVAKLQDLCLDLLIQNFAQSPVISLIPEKFKHKVLESISVELPLALVASLIPDELYWKRRVYAQYPRQVCNPALHGNSWKCLFFELHIQGLIVNFAPAKSPAESDYDALVAQLKLASPFVRRLRIPQLLPSVNPGVLLALSDAAKKDSFARNPNAVEYVHNPKESQPDHIDIEVVFKHLTDISELSLYYGLKDCGINFHQSLFGMSVPDCVHLSHALKLASSLTILDIHASKIDDDKVRLICSALLQNESLRHLCLSHNKIGDRGARGLAKLLASPGSSLTHLDIGDNKITHLGAHTLARALTYNTCLKTLILQLNYLCDEGVESFFDVLGGKSCHLSEIHLGAVGMNSHAVKALCTAIRRNSPVLKRINVSCNKLVNLSTSLEEIRADASSGNEVKSASTDDVTGPMIFDSLGRNKYIVELDVRMTDISSDYEAAIKNLVSENKASKETN